MKPQKAVPIQKSNLKFKSTGDDKMDIELLKKILQKKENRMKNYVETIIGNAKNLYETKNQLSHANEKIKKLEMARKKDEETIGVIVGSIENSAEIIYHMLQKDENNLFPQENYEVIQELKKAIKLFTSLAHSQKNDLLKTENILVFVDQKN